MLLWKSKSGPHRFCLFGCLAVVLNVSASALAQPTYPETTGLQVSLIPAGTRAHLQDSKGKTAIWWFRGKQGEVWVADVTGPDGALLRTEHYNAQGYLVEVIHRDGPKDRYDPYRCDDQAGDCTYVKIDAKGQRTRYKSRVISTGKTFTVNLNGKKNSAFKLGPYNIRIMQRQGNSWTKVTRIGN